MHERTEKLHQIMDGYGLKTADVAKLLGRAPQTVAMWRCRTNWRVIPENTLQLLEFKLGAK